METKEIIALQLAENTGVAMMDSGGARGRMWQRNADRAEALDMSIPEMFEAQPPAYWDGWMVVLSTYHWMVEHLEHDEPMQNRLDRWINLGWQGLDQYEQGPCTNSPSTIDEWLDKLKAKGWVEEHPEFDSWCNTYNSDNLLSQDLQFRCFATTWEHPTMPGESYVAMSTHNGADARGGYSDFKIYRCDPWEMWDWDQFSAHCPQCETHPANPDATLFDEKPYTRANNGWYWHRGGEWTDPNGNYVVESDGAPRVDVRWPTPGLDLPDDFVQSGPVCPIHLINMELSA